MRIRFPRSQISRTFLRYTKPVAARQKRIVYAFVEVQAGDTGSQFDLIEGETGVRPVIIGRYTRAQLAKLTKAQLDEILYIVLPGTSVIRVVGFGHALTRIERKGIKFSRAPKRKRRAPKRNRRTRESSNPRRNKPSKGKSKRRKPRRRA